MAIAFNDSNFDEKVIKADKPVMVDFWATWCGPCRAIAPMVDEISSEYEGRAYIGKVDIDDNNSVAIQYSIQSVPTILFFKNGEIVERVVGGVPKSKLTNILDSLIG